MNLLPLQSKLQLQQECTGLAENASGNDRDKTTLVLEEGPGVDLEFPSGSAFSEYPHLSMGKEGREQGKATANVTKQNCKVGLRSLPWRGKKKEGK